MSKLLITQGRVIDPANGIDGTNDIAIVDGKIANIGKAPDGFAPDKTIDAKGLVVSPGLIDLQTRLGEPRETEHKPSFNSEITAAVKAGVTALCCFPTFETVLDKTSTLELIQQRSKMIGKAKLLPLAAMTQALKGDVLSPMYSLAKAGCVAVTNAGVSIPNTLMLKHCFEYAATYDIPIFISSQDHWLAMGGCAHEGQVATRLGLPAIPAIAETTEITRCLQLLEYTKARVHFSKLSASGSVALIRDAKSRGLSVTADVTAHHLMLSDMDISDYDSRCHVEPPFRTLRDQDALLQGLADGTIDAICSDHCPLSTDEKRLPFQESTPGISGLETLLPIALRLVERLGLSLSDALAKVTQGPQNVLALSQGNLSDGSVADICIFDPEAPFMISKKTLISRGKNTPFLNWEFQGVVAYTLVNGDVVYQAV